MTAVTDLESVEPTPITLGGARGGPNVRTLRHGPWWANPLITSLFLGSFVVYATWAAFQNGHFYVGDWAHRDLISPFYSPCVTATCALTAPSSRGIGGMGWLVLHWWTISPAILVMLGPLSIRSTCYYYRKAYYRSFWQSPPNCSVADGHKRYSGESKFPLLIQNLHRYALYIGMVFNVILTIDAVMAFRMPTQSDHGAIGVSVGSLVLTVNALLLWSYSLGCHAFRHLVGGHLKWFSKHPVRASMWRVVNWFNERHMQLAWISLTFVALTDLYVRLVSQGVFTDPKLF